MNLEAKKQKAREARRKAYRLQKEKFKKMQKKSIEEAKERKKIAQQERDQELWQTLVPASFLDYPEEQVTNLKDSD